LTNLIYGGEKAVAKRRFILSPTDGLDGIIIKIIFFFISIQKFNIFSS
jgi:hypothetical protein